MSEIDIFVYSTSIITLDHMKSLENSTLDGNTGHFDTVIDLVGSEGFGDNIKPSIRAVLPVRWCSSLCNQTRKLIARRESDAVISLWWHEGVVHKLVDAMSSFCGVPGWPRTKNPR